MGKGREGNGREGKGKEEKGKEEKGTEIKAIRPSQLVRERLTSFQGTLIRVFTRK